MHLARHHSAARVAARAGLLALLVGTALSLTQCVQVTDPITGSTVATFSRASTGDCYTACGLQFSNALQAENTLWLANKKACAGDDVCLALERARHDAVVDALKRQFGACRDNSTTRVAATAAAATEPGFTGVPGGGALTTRRLRL